MKRTYKLFAGLALFALLLTACNSGGLSDGGSSGGGGGSDDPPVTEDSYTITWKNWNGTTLETDNNVKKGTTPTYDGVTPTRPDDDEYTYTWSGWDPEVVPATANQTYMATYSYERLTTTYTINFDLNGGTSASYSGPKIVEAFSKDIFFFDCVKEDWNFRGWSYNGTKIFDEKGNQLANPTMAKTMTFVAVYAQTVKMTIVSNLEGAGTITGDGEYPYNTYVDVSAYAKQGYEFIGWYYQNTLLSSTNEYKYMMWSEDVTLEARFKLASFLMNVHTNNQDYGLVSLKSTLNSNYLPEYQEYRDYTTQVTIAAYSKTDVRFLGWYDIDNKLVETNAVYNFVMPNYDYTLEAKWNYFTVSYNLNGGTNNSSNPTSYTIDSTGLILREPTKTGYDFLGWQYKGSYVTEINPSWIDNIELNAIWIANLSVPTLSDDRKTITYGLYPQTNVNNASLVSALNGLTTPESNGWYLYDDGDYYAKVSATPSNSKYVFDNGTPIVSGTTYWFKCEPIVWNVLSNNSGTYYIVSSVLLDTHCYYNSTSTRTIDGQTVYANNYKYSDIRTWLNEDFYNSAFALGNSHIQTTTVNNSASTTNISSNSYACANTEDKVFLPSYQDYINSSYGFSTSPDSNYDINTPPDPKNATRRCKPTDWARARGAFYVRYDGSYQYNAGYYWTRSPLSDNSNRAWSVDYPGGLYSYNNVHRTGCGVRPGLLIRLRSSLNG